MAKFIDHIFYINLDRRTDRREAIENALIEYDLMKISERFQAFDQPVVGCARSHLETIKLARDRKYKNILIFEDDFCFENSKEEFEKKIEFFFTTVENYDVLMLSYYLTKYEETNQPTIRRVLEAYTASAYIINEKYYDKLINLYEESVPLLESTMMHWVYMNDQIWTQFQKTDNWFCFTERVGKQRAGHSDNSECFMDLPY